MNFIYYLSDGMIPFIFIIIIGYGMLNKVDIFDEFVSGAVRRTAHRCFNTSDACRADGGSRDFGGFRAALIILPDL